AWTASPEYYEGIFFADTDLKGDFLFQLINHDASPIKIVFIDDKETQTESVSAALTALGIDHECYFYLATQAKAKAFDPLIANIQLYFLVHSRGQHILSDIEAKAIAKSSPEKTADDYLQAALQCYEGPSGQLLNRIYG